MYKPYTSHIELYIAPRKLSEALRHLFSTFARPSDSAEALAVPFGGTRRQFKGGVRRSLISGSMEEQANPFFSLFRRCRA